MQKIKVLVTGAFGQLGQALQEVASTASSVEFIFTDSTTLDITDAKKVKSFFESHSFDYCVNCAAYTAVDQAEMEQEKAYLVNVTGVQHLAENCQKHEVVLIQISTDYVFDGTTKTPYKEEDTPNPINYYGFTKLRAEQIIQEKLKQYFIIRTSWLYGKSGNNFVKTMLKLATIKKEIKVVDDQIGSPTNAKDLAKFIMHLVTTKNESYGIYHFSNQGQTNWYGFAKEIFNLNNSKVSVIPVSSVDYLTRTKRPIYSVLNTNKVIQKTNFKLRDWKLTLKEFIKTNY